MSVIYEPRGKAREYAPLACNIATGCSHACRYCYCPSITRTTVDQWAKAPTVRKDIVKQFAKEADKMAGNPTEILFCFMCDPYQSDETAHVMGQIYKLAEFHDLNLSVLTKAGCRAKQHFVFFLRNRWKFGSTVSFLSEQLREEWEPGAPSIQSRIQAVEEAHATGITTWVSIEPVVDAEEAMKVMGRLKGHVDLWKVGKLNHHTDVERRIDWKRFLAKSREILLNEQVYWKKDLLTAGA